VNRAQWRFAVMGGVFGLWVLGLLALAVWTANPLVVSQPMVAVADTVVRIKALEISHGAVHTMQAEVLDVLKGDATPGQRITVAGAADAVPGRTYFALLRRHSGYELLPYEVGFEARDGKRRFAFMEDRLWNGRLLAAAAGSGEVVVRIRVVKTLLVAGESAVEAKVLDALKGSRQAGDTILIQSVGGLRVGQTCWAMLTGTETFKPTQRYPFLGTPALLPDREDVRRQLTDAVAASATQPGR